MPRVTINSTNFTAGEVSPKCYGRVDLARYQNGAKNMPNCIVNIHGGAERREGSTFVHEAKISNKNTILIPYVFSTTQAYILEFGEFYMRVYLQSGGLVEVSPGVPYEIATPYNEIMLDDLDYTQGADTMFLFHKSVYPQTLQRFASDSWVLKDAPFTNLPFDETGQIISQVGTLSGAGVGTRNITVPLGGLVGFLGSDVGRTIVYGSGVANIVAFNSQVDLTLDVVVAFPSTTLPSGQWEILGSPQATVTSSAKDPVGAVVTLTATISPVAWRATDVGRFVRINGGLVKIVQYVSTSVVNGIIIEELTSTVGAPKNAWSLEGPIWGALAGYPSCGVLYEQRLCVAGSTRYPQTIWGSRSGLPYDFTIGVNDDQAFSFALPSTGQINPIQRMVATSTLMPFTYGGEYTMEGGNGYALTPTNVKAKAPSVYGSNNVKPVRVGNEVLFVQRSNRKLRSMAYRIESDTYSAPDLTVLAEHITSSGVRSMTHQQEPRSVVWCVLINGTMATLTLDRDEGVTAWTPQNTDGNYKAVATIPSARGDEVWAVVQRTINGQEKRYIERFDSSRYTDCGIAGTSGPGAATWTNLGHLEGKQVSVRADGVYMGKFTVVSGQITLPRNAFNVEIGLPFTSAVTLLRPEIQAGDGTAQGNASRTHEVSLLVSGTIGMKVNGEEVSFREFGPDLLDEAPEIFSGFKRGGLVGWYRGDEQEITISQDEPYPFHLLAVVRKFTVNS